MFPIGHAHNEEEQEDEEPDLPSSYNNENKDSAEIEASKEVTLPCVSEEFEISVAIQRRAKAYRALLKEVDASRELRRRHVILNAIRRFVTRY